MSGPALGVTISGKGITETTRDLDAFRKAAGAVEVASAAMVRAADVMTRSMDRSASSAKQQARTFDELRRAIDPAYASSQRYAEVQRELSGMVERGETSQRAANIVLEQAASRYMGVATASERAARAQQEQANIVSGLTDDYQALRSSVDPMYAASMRYERAVETLNAAHREGVISDTQRARTLRLLNDQMIQTTPAADKAARAANNLGPAFVNAGFQVQDFAVQVASGQSAMIAFAQQAPQLLGVLGFSGGLAIAGAALGTLIAVGMAVAPVLIDMGNKAEDAAKSVDDLAGAVERYNGYAETAGMSSADLGERFGSMGPAARAAAEALMQLERIQVLESMDAAIEQLTERFGGLSRSASVVTRGGIIREIDAAFFELRDELNLTDLQAAEVITTLEALSSAGGFQEQVSAANALNTKFVQLFGTIEDVPAELREISQEALRLAMAASAMIDPAEVAARAAQDTADAIRDQVSAYAQQMNMHQAIALYGRDSAQVEALKREEALRTVDAFIAQHNLAGPVAEMMRAAATAAHDVAVNADATTASLARAQAQAQALASAMAAAAGFSANLDNQIEVINAQITAARSGADAAAAGQMRSLELQAIALRDAAIEAANGEMILIRAANDQYAAQMVKIEALQSVQSELRGYTAETRTASSASSHQAAAVADEAEAWRAALSPLEKYNFELGELSRLSDQLSENDVSQAVNRINAELVNAHPNASKFVDIMTDGLFDGFKGAIDSIGNMFKAWLKEMIATAAKNQILVPILAHMGSGAGTGLAGLAGGTGLLGGVGNALGGNMFAVGANAAAAGGGTAAMIGAAAVPVLAVAAAISFMSKKTKELDSGMRVTVNGMDALAEGFRKVETSRFWGLSKKTKTTYDGVSAEVQDGVGSAVDAMQSGIVDMARVLDVGAGAFSDFAHVLQISTKGLSQDQALAEIQGKLAEMGDSFAAMIPGLDAQIRYGETATAALTRLSSSLLAVRDAADLLGHSFDAAGVAGGALASSLADAFGGIDAMNSSVQAYFGAFYSEQEQIEAATRRATAALSDLGVAMPKSRAEYRAMVDALDLTNEASHDAYAALIGLSGVMDQILPSVAGLTAELAKLQGGVSSGLDAAISAAENAAKANADAAANWYKASGSIREWINRMRGTVSPLNSPAQARASNEAQYQILLANAMAGDLKAAQDITGAADRLLSSVSATARTQAEAALVEARIISDLGLLAGVGDIEGARHDVIRGLISQQSDIMKQARDYIAAGNALTAEMIKTMQTQLGSLDEAIAAAERINYAFLKERLAVTVDVLADADVPEYLRKLLSNAATGVTGYIDFITRSDLAPDLKFLALTEVSDHIRTIEMVAKNKMPADLGAIALKKESDYRVNVMAAVSAGASDILKVITGSKDGKITLGGSFVFDPSNGFKVWYEGTTKAAIAAPMSLLGDAMERLRAMLNGLRVAIIAEGVRAGAPTGLAPAQDAVKITDAVAAPRPPSFAGGGSTGNGARSGGVDGMGGFPAILHPQEIVIDRTSDVFAELKDELVRLRQEVASFKNQSRQIDQASYDETRKIANRVTKWDSEGLPPERTDA